MSTPEADQRSVSQRARDEQIAAERQLKPLEVKSGARPAPVEELLTGQCRHPVAVAGIVENGVVRPLDPNVKLPEHARVIIVSSEES